MWLYHVMQCFHIQLLVRTVLRRIYYDCRTVLRPFVTLEHKTSLKSHGYICRNSQKYIVWVKIIAFSFMPKIIRILSKDHVPWRYFVNVLPWIYQLNFWLVIFISKNFIWTTLKAIFSIFRFFLHPQIPDIRKLYLRQILSYPNKRYINGKLIYSAFRLCINLNFEKLTLKTGFVVQGHISKGWNLNSR